MQTFFFDEHFAPGLVAALGNLGCHTIHIAKVDELGRGTPDETWIPFVAAKSWVVVTQDRNIKRNKHQRLLLEQHKLIGFWVDQVPFAAQPGPYQKAGWLLARWPLIEQLAGGASPGDHFRVRGGKKPHVIALDRIE